MSVPESLVDLEMKNRQQTKFKVLLTGWVPRLYLNFSKRKSGYFIYFFWGGGAEGFWKWDRNHSLAGKVRLISNKLNYIYNNISLSMYTNIIAVWSLACTIVKCVSHQFVHFWTIKYVKSNGAKKNYELFSNLYLRFHINKGNVSCSIALIKSLEVKTKISLLWNHFVKMEDI